MRFQQLSEGGYWLLDFYTDALYKEAYFNLFTQKNASANSSLSLLFFVCVCVCLLLYMC